MVDSQLTYGQLVNRLRKEFPNSQVATKVAGMGVLLQPDKERVHPLSRIPISYEEVVAKLLITPLYNRLLGDRVVAATIEPLPPPPPADPPVGSIVRIGGLELLPIDGMAQSEARAMIEFVLRRRVPDAKVIDGQYLPVGVTIGLGSTHFPSLIKGDEEVVQPDKTLDRGYHALSFALCNYLAKCLDVLHVSSNHNQRMGKASSLVKGLTTLDELIAGGSSRPKQDRRPAVPLRRGEDRVELDELSREGWKDMDREFIPRPGGSAQQPATRQALSLEQLQDLVTRSLEAQASEIKKLEERLKLGEDERAAFADMFLQRQRMCRLDTIIVAYVTTEEASGRSVDDNTTAVFIAQRYGSIFTIEEIVDAVNQYFGITI